MDAEGQDPLVLEGAQQLLRARSIDVVEFEYIARGFWRKDHVDQRHLSHVLDRLDSFGYRCYWQGDSGKLARANGGFWCDGFQFRFRSNLVCSHLPSVLQAFEALSIPYL